MALAEFGDGGLNDGCADDPRLICLSQSYEGDRQRCRRKQHGQVVTAEAFPRMLPDAGGQFSGPHGVS